MPDRRLVLSRRRRLEETQLRERFFLARGRALSDGLGRPSLGRWPRSLTHTACQASLAFVVIAIRVELSVACFVLLDLQISRRSFGHGDLFEREHSDFAKTLEERKKALGGNSRAPEAPIRGRRAGQRSTGPAG